MIPKSIDAISEVDLRELIEARVPEGKRIEYKRELPDGSDQGKVKFLKSVTAFANTQGGDLVYGVAAADGIPQELVPLSISSVDQTILRLEQLCAGGVDPRLAGVQYRFVPLTATGFALVIRVAKSWNAPHRVTTGGHSHFYGRSAAGAYQLDVSELRQAFTLAGSVAERIRAFRADRLLALGSGNAPLPMVEGALTILHVVPLQSMTSDFRLDLASKSQSLLKIAPPNVTGWDQRLNLDGRIAFRPAKDNRAASYALLFRSGIVETVICNTPWENRKHVHADSLESDVITVLGTHLPALQELGIAPPAYVFLSLIGVTGHSFVLGSRFMRDFRDPHADRDALILPEVLIEDWKADPPDVMRSTFDMIWNAFGYERSFNYDENGRWAVRN